MEAMSERWETGPCHYHCDLQEEVQWQLEVQASDAAFLSNDWSRRNATSGAASLNNHWSHRNAARNAASLNNYWGDRNAAKDAASLSIYWSCRITANKVTKEKEQKHKMQDKVHRRKGGNGTDRKQTA